MVAKGVLVLCAQALIAKCITSQSYGTPWNTPYVSEAPLSASWASSSCTATPFATAEWATNFAPAASNGGAFPIKSTSSIPVTGVSMTSENAYEGQLSVCGAVPFIAAVGLEGCLPTAGSGDITYGCGNGDVAMLSEDIAYSGAYGYGYGYNRGCGCGAIY